MCEEQAPKPICFQQRLISWGLNAEMACKLPIGRLTGRKVSAMLNVRLLVHLSGVALRFSGLQPLANGVPVIGCADANNVQIGEE